MKKYDVLLFDADATVLNFDADMAVAFEKLYHHFEFDKQEPYSPEQLERYERCNQRWWRRFEQKLCTKPELYYTRFRDYLEETGFPGDPKEINEMYFHYLSQGGEIYPGAKELLETLSAEYKIYIATNGNVITQPSRLENSGLMPYIQDIFVSEAMGDGAGKPDRSYFDYIAAHVPNFNRERTVMIGDSMFSDIQGAHNAGIDSIWYTGVVGDQPVLVEPTYRANSYEEILAILNG